MVYVPLSREQAARLRQRGSLDGPVAAHTATAALLRAHDLAADSEDAQYTALAYAGVSALLATEDPLRLVVAAEIAESPANDDPDDPFGRVQLAGLAWTSVTSLFADDPVSAKRVDRARKLADDLDFAAVVDDEQIEALLDESDLLWFAPSELGSLLGPDG